MKTQNRFFRLVLLVILTIGLTSCSKDEVVPPVQVVDTDKDGIADADDNCPSQAGPASNNGCPINEVGEIIESDGISTDEFDTYAGEVGFVLDARELVKKGYLPATAEVSVQAAQGNYSQTIAIDPISFLGQIKLLKENLTAEAVTELTDGVLVTSIIKDAGGQIILTDPEATVSFTANPSPKKVNAINLSETDENRTINLSENTSYYFQPIDEDGNPEPEKSMAMRGEDQDYIMTISSGTDFNGEEETRNFSFIPIPGKANTFAIRIKSGGRFLNINFITNSATYPSGSGSYTHVGLTASEETDFNSIQDNAGFHFKIEKIDAGIYELQNSGGSPVRVAPGIGLTLDLLLLPGPVGFLNPPPVTSQPIRWRLISTTIDWEVQNVGTTFLEPILGEAKTDFKFNSTLTNCGQGSLSQTVGVVETERENGTVGWEESLSINTTNSVNVSATVGVSFDAKFFGTGATYNASMTVGYDYSRSVTESNSKFEEQSREVGTETFSERTVTVPSGSASIVYDAFQFYENTKVNFVQRLRISGVDSQTGQSLSGDEIRSQFHFSGFDGVITNVEPTSIVITLRGTKVLDKIIDTESNVVDVAANCGS